MKCSKCGLVLPDDSEFCQYCGAKLNRDTPAVSIENTTPSLFSEEPTKQPEPLDISADTIAEPVVVEEVHEPIVVSEDLATPVIVADTPLANNNESDVQTEPSIVPTPLVSQEHSDTVSPSKTANKRKIKQRYCKFCGHKIDCTTKKCTGCGKQYLRWKMRFSTVLLVLGLIASVTANLLQHLSILILKTEVQFLPSLDAAIVQLYNSNIGFASDNFKTENGVVVLQANGAKKEMLLTAGISRNKLLLIQNSDNDVATVSVAKKTAFTSTITITPLKKGATVATFYSSYDSESFKVLIVVTD